MASRFPLPKWVARKVPAGVFQLTLGISIVIAMLCAAMILLIHYQRTAFIRQSLDDALRENALSGIEYGMAIRTQLNLNTPTHLDLFQNEADSVMITRKPWGLYEIILVEARRGDHRGTRIAMISAQSDEIGMSSLYVPENNSPIYLVGDTRIEGTAYVSERKFSTGYIDGKGFQKKQFTNGDIKQSTQSVPKLDSALLMFVTQLFDGVVSGIDQQENYPVARHYSFREPTYWYYTSQSIDLSDSLSGNLIIQSDIKVRVTASATLEDVILIAPQIEIDKEFMGRVQCFASRYIDVGSDAVLSYPSALVLMGQEQDSLISMRPNSVLEGQVVIKGYDVSIASKGTFSLQKGSILHGSAYINGQANIQGRVWGHLMARNLVTMNGTTPYASHLLNAELSASKKSKAMPGSLLWGNTKEMKVVKWLK